MHRLRLVSTAAAIAALSFGVVACGDDDDEGSSGGGGEDVSDASFDLNVGVLVPQTGDLSAFGPAGEKAANVAAEQVSAALEEAGADGITVEASVEDSQTEPAAAQSAATKLISGGSSCLVGPWSSGETVPVGRSVAASRKTPLISPSAHQPGDHGAPRRRIRVPHGPVRRAPGSGHSPTPWSRRPVLTLVVSVARS